MTLEQFVDAYPRLPLYALRVLGKCADGSAAPEQFLDFVTCGGRTNEHIVDTVDDLLALVISKGWSDEWL